MELIFSGYGIEIIKRDGRFVVRYDSGEIVSNIIEKEITEDEAIKAQKSEKDAYEMLLLRECRP